MGEVQPPFCGNVYWLCVLSCSVVSDPVTSWIEAFQAPLSVEIFQQEYWSGLPIPPLVHPPNPGIKPMSPALAGRFFTTPPPGKPVSSLCNCWKIAEDSALLLLECWIQEVTKTVPGNPFFFFFLPADLKYGNSQMVLIKLHRNLNTYLCLVAQSCLTLCDPMDCSLPGSSVHEDSPGKNTGVGCHALLQGSSQPRDWTQVSCIAGRIFTIWTTREAHLPVYPMTNQFYS